MLKVFIAEDEPLIRDALRESVLQLEKQLELSYCGEASDGEMALSMMQEVKPDLLLTDIKMPFMDGLTLAKYAKELLPWLHTIIISGFDDFKYTQQAIAIGVDGYLSKPLQNQEFIEVIQMIQKKIEKEKHQQGTPDNQERIINLEYYKEHFFYKLAAGAYTTPQILDRQEKLHFQFAGQQFVPLCVRFFDEQISEVDYQKFVLRLAELFQDDPHVLTVLHDSLVLECLTSSATRQEAVNKSYSVADILKYEFERLGKHNFAICIGEPCERLTEIAKVLLLTNQFSEDFGAANKGKIFSSNDPQQHFRLSSEQLADLIDIDDVAALNSTLARYKQLMTQSDQVKLADDGVGSYNYLVLKTFLDTFRNNTDPVSQKLVSEYPEQDLLLISRIPTLFQTITEVFWQHLKSLNRQDIAAPPQKHPIVETVYQKLQKDFDDPNLSLQFMADFVEVSPAYLSTLFSQTMGTTFIESLTQIRLKKAQELLQKTDMKITDITFEIGYTDPNYFSYLFKKRTGLTPKEYRKQQKS